MMNCSTECPGEKTVRVKIPADLSYTGNERQKDAKIDSCIADIVEALQAAGIDMRASCCGHGKQGSILLQDGRKLIITQKQCSGMPAGYKFDSEVCPECGQPVAANWIVRHRKANCEVG